MRQLFTRTLCLLVFGLCGLAVAPAVAQDDDAVTPGLQGADIPPGMQLYEKRVPRVSPRGFSIFGDDDDDDDDSWGVEATDVRSLFEGYGVRFPQGSNISYNPNASKLIVTNTPEELAKVKRILEEIIRMPSQVEIACTVFRISPQLAGDWGLDGLPPGKPDTMPFPDRIPRVLDHDAGIRLFAALRADPGFAIIGHAQVTTISGNTANTQSVERTRLIESYSEPSVRETTDAEGTVTGRERSTPLMSVPEMGDEQEFGASLTVTPTVGDDDYTIDIELRPTYNEIIGWQSLPADADARTVNTPIPIVGEHSTETRVLIYDGHTILLASTMRGPPGIQQRPGAGRQAAEPPPGLVFFAVKATLVRPGFEKERDTRRPIAEDPDTRHLMR